MITPVDTAVDTALHLFDPGDEGFEDVEVPVKLSLEQWTTKLIAVYHEERGPKLPGVRSASLERQASVKKLLKECKAHGYDPVEVVRGATRWQKNNKWHVDNGLGFDNLRRKSNFIERYESYLETAQPNTELPIGKVVTLWRGASRDRARVLGWSDDGKVRVMEVQKSTHEDFRETQVPLENLRLAEVHEAPYGSL